MNGLAFCAGIGGLELAIKQCVPSYRTACYVEREVHVAAVLVARMQEGALCKAPIWSDLRTFDASPWRGKVDIISAGYPCQPFSVAGKRKGAHDSRHLWPFIAKHIGAIRPGIVFCENVSNHLALGFEQVCEDLSRMGYHVEAGIFSAAEVGAHHLRKRLFFVAYTNDMRQLHETERRNQERDRVTCSSGYRNTWPVEPSVGRVAHGIPFRVDRLRALGNAVVPATAAFAFHTLTQKAFHE